MTPLLCSAFPEYNHAVPGVLKNLVDWASRPFGVAPLMGKVSSLAVASKGHGGYRAMAELARVLRDLGGFVVPAPEVCIPRAHERLSIDEFGALHYLDRSEQSTLELLLQSLHHAAMNRVGEHTAAPWREHLAVMRR